MFLRANMATPLGEMTAITSDSGLCFLDFSGPKCRPFLDARWKRWYGAEKLIDGDNDIMSRTQRWLASYFSGKFDELPAVAVDVRGSDFEIRVWRLLQTIPPGATAAYGEVARKLGDANGARAVGGAVGRNPVSLIIPCHRIIGSDGSLTGYGGGIANKKWLLAHEKSARPK